MVAIATSRTRLSTPTPTHQPGECFALPTGTFLGITVGCVCCSCEGPETGRGVLEVELRAAVRTADRAALDQFTAFRAHHKHPFPFRKQGVCSVKSFFTQISNLSIACYPENIILQRNKRAKYLRLFGEAEQMRRKAEDVLPAGRREGFPCGKLRGKSRARTKKPPALAACICFFMRLWPYSTSPAALAASMTFCATFAGASS